VLRKRGGCCVHTVMSCCWQTGAMLSHEFMQLRSSQWHYCLHPRMFCCMDLDVIRCSRSIYPAGGGEVYRVVLRKLPDDTPPQCRLVAGWHLSPPGSGISSGWQPWAVLTDEPPPLQTLGVCPIVSGRGIVLR